MGQSHKKLRISLSSLASLSPPSSPRSSSPSLSDSSISPSAPHAGATQILTVSWNALPLNEEKGTLFFSDEDDCGKLGGGEAGGRKAMRKEKEGELWEDQTLPYEILEDIFIRWSLPPPRSDFLSFFDFYSQFVIVHTLILSPFPYVILMLIHRLNPRILLSLKSVCRSW